MTFAKKTIALAIVAMFVTSGLIVIADNVVIADSTYDVELVDFEGTVRGTYSGEYAIHNALADADPTDIVKLLRSFTGVGIMISVVDPGATTKTYMINLEGGTQGTIEKDLTIDFNGFIYKVDTPVGSTGNETQGFHVEQDYKLKLMNGTVAPADNNASLQHPLEMLIYNQGADIVFDDMTLDGSNLVQGNNTGTKDSNVYTLSNGSDGNTKCKIKDSTIIACKDKLENDKKAFAFSIAGSKTLEIVLRGDVVLDGGIEYNSEVSNAVPVVTIKGNVLIKSGTLYSEKSPMLLEVKSGALTMAEGVALNKVVLLDGTDYPVELFELVAGAAGIQVAEDYASRLVVTGEFKSNTEHSAPPTVHISEYAQNVRVSGVFCNGVTLFNESETTTVVGVLEFQSGSKLEIDSFTEPLIGTSEGSYVIFDKGSYKGDTRVTEDVTYRIDDKGSEPKQVIIVILETSEHVESITYDGKTIIEFDYTSAGVTIDLSKISVAIDRGFELVGFNVDGKTFASSGTVTINNTCVITAIAQEEIVSPASSDNVMPIIGSIMVVFIGLMVLLMIFRGKE